MRYYRSSTYYCMITGAFSLAICVLQLLGKVSTVAAMIAAMLTVAKVLFDLSSSFSTRPTQPLARLIQIPCGICASPTDRLISHQVAGGHLLVCQRCQRHIAFAYAPHEAVKRQLASVATVTLRA